MAQQFDRSQEDSGNSVQLEHLNLRNPDQRLATLFYLVGMGFTRDPYLMVGLDNMWINIGRSQIHTPNGEAQRLNGTIGIVLPDLKRYFNVPPALGSVSSLAPLRANG